LVLVVDEAPFPEDEVVRLPLHVRHVLCVDAFDDGERAVNHNREAHFLLLEGEKERKEHKIETNKLRNKSKTNKAK
jgi:hypothetical protein